MSTIDDTLAERGQRYGEFTGHALITQSLKDVMRQGDHWLDLEDDQMEALEMVAHKVGRILNGDPNYLDSWTDIIGYVRLVEKRLLKEQIIGAAIRKPIPAHPSDRTFDAGAAAATQSNQCSIGESIRNSKPTGADVAAALRTLTDAGIITLVE